MTIQESGEMYLESILVLGKTNDIVHAIDIAKYMGVSKPAVSKALAKYKEEKLLEIDTSGNITLTNEGLNIAKKIYERHVLLTSIFSLQLLNYILELIYLFHPYTYEVVLE